MSGLSFRSSPRNTQSHPGLGSGRKAPAGCAFSGYSISENTLYTPNGVSDPQRYLSLLIEPQSTQPSQSSLAPQEQERKTIIDLLYSKPLIEQTDTKVSDADALLASETDVLATALGAPARRFLQHAEEIGPMTGWKDGHLSSKHGFLPPDPSDSRIALTLSPGRVWMDVCERMSGLVSRGKVREKIRALPLVLGVPEVIPDSAIWAATAILSLIATT